LQRRYSITDILCRSGDIQVQSLQIFAPQILGHNFQNYTHFQSCGKVSQQSPEGPRTIRAEKSNEHQQQNIIASWVEKVGGPVSRNFLTDSFIFLKEGIIVDQNFNIAPKLPQNGFFSSKFCIFGRTFSDKKII